MAYRGPIVDVDIHHKPGSDADILPYLPKEWQEYARGNGKVGFSLRPPAARGSGLFNNGARRADSFPADGGPPGSDYELLRDQLLDRYDFYRGLITWDLGEYATHLNRYFAAAMCRAANDWNIETWLSRDKRLVSVAVVPSADPQLAAAELRRVGEHPQIVGVLMSGNPIGRPWGDPHFDPIYEAAAELGLAVSSHVAGGDRPRAIAEVAGTFANGIEHISQLGLGGMHYVSSFITNGVFEKFPTLKLLMVEYGLGWIPPLLWRLDKEIDLLRSESPWVRRMPSEYVRDHVSFSTQPIEESPHSKRALAQLLDTVEGIEDMLCFSTDYPHITMDDPMYVSQLIPQAWHRKVFFENACKVYNLPLPMESTSKDDLSARKDNLAGAL
jgi:uncharacterized protein